MRRRAGLCNLWCHWDAPCFPGFLNQGKKMKLNKLRLAAAAALCGAAVSAQAITVKLDFANGSVGMTVGKTNLNTDVSASVGAFKGVTGADVPYDTSSFVTYCVELTQNFGLNIPYTDYTLAAGNTYFSGITPLLSVSSTTVVSRLNKLFSYLGGASTPSGATNSAAIQLAVWESIYEGTNYGNVDRSLADAVSGSFDATGSGSGAAITAANTLLSNVIAWNGSSIFSVKVLTNANQQDFLVLESGGGGPQGIPEPGSIALSLAALGGLVFARRRRAASSQS
jgi:hypothetical protein